MRKMGRFGLGQNKWVSEKTDIEQILVIGTQVVKSHSVLLIET
jgi:hypothetical protein